MSDIPVKIFRPDVTPECEHIATVTTPTWPVVHRSPVAVGDGVLVLPPILVTECVTCNARVDPTTEGA